nr:aldo/keto reductase [Brachyspira pilosicoli]
MNYILKSSNIMPKFGIGTLRMGENESKSSIEINAVYCALKNGVRLIDTAEMYGEGGAEIVVGEALKKACINRKEFFIVSKVILIMQAGIIYLLV